MMADAYVLRGRPDDPAHPHAAIAIWCDRTRQLGYRVLLGADWWFTLAPPAQIEHPSRGLEALAVFRAADGTQLQLITSVCRYDIALADWLRLHARLNGFVLDDIAATERGAGQVAQAIARSTGGQLWRLAAVAAGGRVGLLVGTAGPSADEYARARLGVIASGFEATGAAATAPLEPLQRLIDPLGLVGLTFPASWSVRMPDVSAPAASVVELRLVDRGDTRAIIRVAADARSSADQRDPETLLADRRQELVASGLALSPLTAHRHASLSQWRGRWRYGESAGPLVISVLRGPRGWITALSIGPDPRPDISAWLRSCRAYQHVLASLATNGERSQNRGEAP